MRVLGLHLLQSLDLVATPRRSAVAELDAAGRLAGLWFADSDEAVVATLGRGPALVAVDAPIRVPNETGRRDAELVLAWCDIPAFPVSRRRLTQVYGGLRGAVIAAAAPADLELVETLPDLALRLMMWEETGGGAPMDLAEYRERWLGLRPPAYRPKGPGRARPAGIAAAYAIVARHLDLGGWAPPTGADDWSAMRDAAALDAILCASVGLREGGSGQALRLGDLQRGEMLVPVDANLRARIEINLARLRDEGAIGG